MPIRVPPTSSAGSISRSMARSSISRAAARFWNWPLLGPAAALWLVYVALTLLMLPTGFAVFSAGSLASFPSITAAAYALAPDTFLNAGDGATLLIYVVIVSLALVSWCWGMRIARHMALPSAWSLIGCSALVLTPLLAMPGLLSDDVYLYNLYGRTISVYGANPIVSAPSTFTDDPHLPWVHWQDLPSAYGPVWLMLSAMLSGVAGDSLNAAVLMYRLAGAALHLATSAVIWQVLRERRPAAAVTGTIFYAWNPLVLIEAVGNAHNDVLVGLCAVLLVAAATRRAWLAAVVFGACALMVKPFAVLLAPGLARAMVQRTRGRVRLRLLMTAAGIAAATVVITSLPLWAGTRLLSNILQNPAATMYTNTVWELIALTPASLGVTMRDLQHPYLDAVRTLCFLAAAAWVLTRRFSRNYVAQSAWQLWVAFCFTASWVWPWYFLPALALAPLAGMRALPLAMGLTLGGLLFWTAWPEPTPWPVQWLYGWRAVVLFGPAALACWAPARRATYLALGLRRNPRGDGADPVDIQLQRAAG